MNHCIPLLKSCHDITSKLVPITMKECQSEAENAKVEEMAKKVTPRIDDVVQLLDGALDLRLVEARSVPNNKSHSLPSIYITTVM